MPCGRCETGDGLRLVILALQAPSLRSSRTRSLCCSSGQRPSRSCYASRTCTGQTPRRLDLLAYLAHHVAGRRLLLVGTYRPEETGSRERMERFADVVRRSESTLLVSLGPLTDEQVVRLLTLRAGSELDGPRAASIAARSQGNPFFAEELLAAGGGEVGDLPESLRALLLRRVTRLARRTQDLLRVLAAVGGEAPPDLLVRAAGLTEPAARELLRAAVDQGVVVVDREATGFRFRHALLAEAVYSTILPGERQNLHARIARGLAASDAPAAALAHHWAVAGHPSEALVASVRAARAAEQLFGLTEAYAHMERAVSLWPAVPDAAEQTGVDLVDALAETAALAAETGAAPRAVELVRQALQQVPPEQTDRLVLLHISLADYLHQSGRTDWSLETIQQAVELLPAEPAGRHHAQALAALAAAQMHHWRHAESLKIAEHAVATALNVGSAEARLRAMTVRGINLAYLGRGQEGIAVLRDTLRTAEAERDRAGLQRSYANLTDVLTMLGRPCEAAELARAGLTVLHEYGLDSAVLRANLLEALIVTGEWDEADAVSARALRSITRTFPYMLLMLRADLETGRGDFAAAAAHLGQARETLRPDRGLGIFDIYLAELALWQRRWIDAARSADQALRLTRTARADTGQLQVWFCAKGMRAQAELVSLARARRDTPATRSWTHSADALMDQGRSSTDTAAAVTPNAHGWLALAEAEHSRVHDTNDPGPWHVAASSWDRLDRPPLAAYCRWREAETLVTAGASRAEAQEPLRQAYRVATTIGATPLAKELHLLAQRGRLEVSPTEERPPPVECLEQALGLTPREAEVLALVARGLTNREIAEHLVISEKTASVHVSHILRKLDVSNRQQAAAIAHKLN